MAQRSNVNPPDVCLFRVENAVDYVTCGSLDDAFGITALGTRDGAVGVHSLDATNRPLYRLRTQIGFDEEVDEISALLSSRICLIHLRLQVNCSTSTVRWRE